MTSFETLEQENNNLKDQVATHKSKIQELEITIEANEKQLEALQIEKYGQKQFDDDKQAISFRCDEIRQRQRRLGINDSFNSLFSIIDIKQRLKAFNDYIEELKGKEEIDKHKKIPALKQILKSLLGDGYKKFIGYCLDIQNNRAHVYFCNSHRFRMFLQGVFDTGREQRKIQCRSIGVRDSLQKCIDKKISAIVESKFEEIKWDRIRKLTIVGDIEDFNENMEWDEVMQALIIEEEYKVGGQRYVASLKTN